MSVVVITPPAPIVAPEALGGSSDDQALISMIAAVTEEIDGPGGWLGRSLGPQTLELRQDGFPSSGSVVLPLPGRPVIEIVSVKFIDSDGIERTVNPDLYGKLGDHAIYPKPGFSWPSSPCDPDSVRIRYRAGYNGIDAGQANGTGPVPERARSAIILAVRNLQSLNADNLFLRSEEVEGIGTRQYTVSDVASRIVREAADRLLSTLRVYAS